MYIGMPKINRVIECTTRRNLLFMPIFFSKWIILHGWNKFISDIFKMNFIFHEFSWMNFLFHEDGFKIHIIHKNGCKENMKCELKTFQLALNMLKSNLEGSLNFERVWFFFWGRSFSRSEKKCRHWTAQNFFLCHGQFTKQIWTRQFGNIALVVWNW